MGNENEISMPLIQTAATNKNHLLSFFNDERLNRNQGLMI